MKEIEVTYMATDDIIPYVNNPRINDHAVDAVASSIKNFGFKVPIIVDAGNEIVAGHTRLKAAKKLGLKEVPVVIADDLDEGQVRAFRVADNKVTELSEWDIPALEIELTSLGDLFTGFELDEVGSLLGSDVDAIEDGYELSVPEEPCSRYGDVYQLGRHRLMCGDSTVAADAVVLMGGSSAEMVFTDPPWNVNYGDVEEGNPMGYIPRTILNDFMGTEEFKAFMFSAFKRMNECVKPGAMVYVVMSAQEWGNMMLTLAQNSFHWSSTIIWNKDRLVLSRKDYHTKYEPIWYGWKSGAPRLRKVLDRKQSDVWDIDRTSVNELHPTMKPVELVSRAITNSSVGGDAVLDLFGGSGTTLIACEQLNRTCYMMELDPKYVDVIVDRWETFTGQTAELIERRGDNG